MTSFRTHMLFYQRPPIFICAFATRKLRVVPLKSVLSVEKKLAKYCVGLFGERKKMVDIVSLNSGKKSASAHETVTIHWVSNVSDFLMTFSSCLKCNAVGNG